MVRSRLDNWYNQTNNTMGEMAGFMTFTPLTHDFSRLHSDLGKRSCSSKPTQKNGRRVYTTPTTKPLYTVRMRENPIEYGRTRWEKRVQQMVVELVVSGSPGLEIDFNLLTEIMISQCRRGALAGDKQH